MRPNALRKALTGAVMTVGVLALGASAAAAAETYEVRPGDTLSKIAHAHDQVSTWRDLHALNADVVADPNLIFPGQQLRLTGEAPATSPSGGGNSSTSPSGSSADSGSSSETSSSSSPSSSSSSAPASASTSTWDALAQCESNGNWSINTGNGYYGGLQFALSSWRAVGGSGYPHEASKAEQIRRAELLLEKQGWGAWPACSSKLGLR